MGRAHEWASRPHPYPVQEGHQLRRQRQTAWRTRGPTCPFHPGNPQQYANQRPAASSGCRHRSGVRADPLGLCRRVATASAPGPATGHAGPPCLWKPRPGRYLGHYGGGLRPSGHGPPATTWQQAGPSGAAARTLLGGRPPGRGHGSSVPQRGGSRGGAYTMGRAPRGTEVKPTAPRAAGEPLLGLQPRPVTPQRVQAAR